MSSSACPLTAKPSEQPAAEKQASFNIENQPPNVVSSEETNRKKSIPRRYIVEFYKDPFRYEYANDEINLMTQGANFLSTLEFTNPVIFKAIAHLYEKAFWGNELQYTVYELFCFRFMSVKDEKLIQQIIEANYENFIDSTMGRASRAEIYPIASIYKKIGNHHLYELWKRIADTVELHRDRS